MNDETRRRIEQEKRNLAGFAKYDALQRNAEARWDIATAQARIILGPHFNEFVELCALANEQRTNDPFMVAYVDNNLRAGHLRQVRTLMDQHRAAMERKFLV